MNRRAFLGASGTVFTTGTLAGCVEGQSEPDNSEPKYDAVIDFSTHVQDSRNGEYELMDPQYDGWSWIVVDFEVLKGELDMGDVWARGIFETEERYYTVSAYSDDVENGIENRGAIREGNRGIVLHAYPPSPASGLIGPVFSATRTAIGGENVRTEGPDDLYPPVSIEYSTETARNPDVLPDEYEADEGDTWAIATIEVVDGLLNLADVWFRSRLTTDARIYDCHPFSRLAKRGVRSRGIVKEGYGATALYQISEGSSIESLDYEDPQQDVTVSRA